MLQKELGLTEPEAFRWIQKTAMDLRRSMREVAEGVVEHGVSGLLTATPGSPVAGDVPRNVTIAKLCNIPGSRGETDPP